MRSFSVLFLMIFSFGLWAQTPDSNEISEQDSMELVNIFHEYERRLRCDFSDKILAQLKDVDESALQAQLKSEIYDVEDILKNKRQVLLKSEKKLLRKQKRVLKKLLRSTKKKTKLKKFFQNLCIQFENKGGDFLKGMGHVANIINQTATFPIRFTYRLGKGIANGEVRDRGRKSLYQTVGKNIHQSVAFFALWQGFKLLAGTNYYLYPLFATPMADLMVEGICENPNEFNAKEVKFCKNFYKVKDKFYQAVMKGEVWGAKLGKKLKKNKEEIKVEEWKEEVTEENVCSFLANMKKNMIKSKKAQHMGQVYGLMLNPGYFAHPLRYDLEMDEDLVVKQSKETKGQLKNIIISLGPKEHIQKEIILNGFMDEYKEESKRFGKMKNTFKRMYSKKSLEKCEKLKKKKNFLWKEYKELKDKITPHGVVNNYKHASYIQQHDLVANMVKQARGAIRLTKKTKLNWEIISANDINEVHKILRRSDLGNVVMVTHSYENGKKLVDANLNQYPSRYFNDISPSIMSLSFYSCHSQNVLDTYSLEQKFLETPSYHKKKHLFFVAENQLFGKSTYAPLTGFKDYLIKVDNYLFRSMQGNMLFQSLNSPELKEESEQEVCRVSLGKKLKVKKGTLTINVNRRFVGAIDIDTKKNSFEFPCSHLDRDDLGREDNIVYLHGINLLDKLKLDESKIEIKLSHPTKSYKVLKSKHIMSRKTGNYSSSKVTFSSGE